MVGRLISGESSLTKFVMRCDFLFSMLNRTVRRKQDLITKNSKLKT